MKPSPRSSHSGGTDIFLIICLTLIAAGISIASILLMWQRNELLQRQVTQLQSSVSQLNQQAGLDWRGTAPDPSSDPAQISYGEIVRRFEITANGQKYHLTHFCSGAVQLGPTDGGNRSYCMGMNQLVLSDGTANTLLDATTVTSTAQVPFLKEPEVLGGSASTTRFLLSYAPDTCASLGECGPDSVQRAKSHLFTLETKSVRVLKNFPAVGAYVWNPSYLKAVVTPHKCSATGCTSAALIGYDLQNDQIKELGKEKAADAELAFDTEGKRLPFWKNVQWTNESTIKASIVSPDGKTAKEITEKF
ncbi:hypothetical protein KBA73_00160 [Patescibacteria group bacterium]|nr:hypothetical protein [Patescibacteria group bacterium]